MSGLGDEVGGVEFESGPPKQQEEKGGTDRGMPREPLSEIAHPVKRPGESERGDDAGEPSKEPVDHEGQNVETLNSPGLPVTGRQNR